MRAVTWHGKRDIRVESVIDPGIVNPRDAIVRVLATAIGGFDLHVYNGLVPSMRTGDVLGHEFMGEVVDLGPEVRAIHRGDRVVVSSIIACGACWFCSRGEFAYCDNSNPNAVLADKVFGHSAAGRFGHSHVFGGYAGGQAEYVRVPFADVGCMIAPPDLDDERVLMLSDVLPTAWMAAANAGVSAGDVVAVFGCGAIGQLAIRSAFIMGAERVFAIDEDPRRLDIASAIGGAEAIDDRSGDVLEVIDDLTGGRGADACIDAVGLEARGSTPTDVYDRVMQVVAREDRGAVLRSSIRACRKGGVVSVVGDYAGMVDKFPFGVAFNKGLTIRMGPTHCQKHMRPLLELVEKGTIDASFIVTHHLALEDAPDGYDAFQRKLDGCMKVVLRP